MRLVRFRDGGGAVTAWADAAGALRRASDPFGVPTPGPVLARVEEVELLAPCVPGKVVAVAAAYPGVTGHRAGAREPLVFLKPASSVCGPGAVVECPFPPGTVWGESELAVVVGRKLRHGDEAQARAAILGYTAANDVTAEAPDGADHHLARSKGADGFCPLGPHVAVGFDPAGRVIEGLQQGELIRRGRSEDRAWDDARLLAWLSSWMTLEPWDVVLTGAPPRVTAKRYVADGDEYVVRISGLGELRNPFRYVAERAS